MSQENVEVVRRCYGLGADRDFSTLSELAHPDAVFDLSRNVFNPGVHRGLDGFRHFVEQVDEMWEDFQIEPQEFIDAGDNVFVASRISGGVAAAVSRSRCGRSPSGLCVRARYCESRPATGTAPKPSKPPGCGSSGTRPIEPLIGA